MADQICSGAQVVADMSQLVVVGTHDFLVEGAFADSPDKAVRHVILPMLSDQTGVNALLEEVDVMRDWVESSDANTEGVLTKRLEDAFSSASESDREKIIELSRALSVSLNSNEEERDPDA